MLQMIKELTNIVVILLSITKYHFNDLLFGCSTSAEIAKHELEVGSNHTSIALFNFLCKVYMNHIINQHEQIGGVEVEW